MNALVLYQTHRDAIVIFAMRGDEIANTADQADWYDVTTFYQGQIEDIACCNTLRDALKAARHPQRILDVEIILFTMQTIVEEPEILLSN